MLPEKVNISGIDYTVLCDQHLIITEESQTIRAAEIDIMQHVISISSFRRDQQDMENSLVHEIVHGIIADRGLARYLVEGEEEYFVENFARGLHQVLKDNELDFTSAPKE